jgi:hypothetical protein
MEAPTAPLLAGAVVEEFFADVVDAAAEVDATRAAVVAAAGDEPEAAGAEEEPPIGAVDWPAISAETEALKVPVIDAIVYMAEKAIWGYCVLLASFNVRDCMRMKYSLPLGPMLASTLNWIEEVDETFTEGVTVCNSVC